MTDLYSLERQIRSAEEDLAAQVRISEVKSSAVGALKCERLYRTVDALKARRDALLHDAQALRPHVVPAAATGKVQRYRNAGITDRRRGRDGKDRRNTPRTHFADPVAINDGSWQDAALAELDALAASEEYRHAGPYPYSSHQQRLGRRSRFSSDSWRTANTSKAPFENEENTPLPSNLDRYRPRSTERWLSIPSCDDPDAYEWKGRTIRVVRGVIDRDRDLLTALLRKAERLEQRLASLEGGGQDKGKGGIEATWDEETKQRVEAGDAIGEERIAARAAVRKKLAEHAELLNREIAEESAVNVQSAFRGMLGRRKMREARAKYNAEIQQQGATIIQSRFRSHMAGKDLLKRKEQEQREMENGAALTIQSQMRGRAARREFANARTNKEKKFAAAKMIQAWWRGCVGRRTVGEARRKYMAKAEEDAAIMVQCAWRSRCARQQVVLLREERLRAYEEAAAMMVQAAFRGMQARRKVATLRREKRDTDDKLARMDYADRVKTQFYAKGFLSLQQRAAVVIQAHARAFLERKRIRKLKGARAREAAEDKEIERMLRQQQSKRGESDSSNREEGLETLEQGAPGKSVFEDELWLPLDHADGRRQETKVNVVVTEIKNPYQLKIAVQDLTSKTQFRRAIDVGILEQLLSPMFSEESIVMEAGPMLEWVTTGRPPKRRELILWILHRMWIERDKNGELELNLASVAAEPHNELDKTLTAALAPSSPSFNRTIEATVPLDRAMQQRKHISSLPEASPLVAPKKSARARDSFVVRYAQNSSP